jgi:hypothetical protein
MICSYRNLKKRIKESKEDENKGKLKLKCNNLYANASKFYSLG